MPLAMLGTLCQEQSLRKIAMSPLLELNLQAGLCRDKSPPASAETHWFFLDHKESSNDIPTVMALYQL